MTTFELPPSWGTLRLPTTQEIRRMLTDPRVMRTVIVCATIAFVALLGSAVSVLLAGKDLYILGFVIVTPLVSLLTAVLRRQKAQERRLDQVVAQTAQTPAQGS